MPSVNRNLVTLQSIIRAMAPQGLRNGQLGRKGQPDPLKTLQFEIIVMPNFRKIISVWSCFNYVVLMDI